MLWFNSVWFQHIHLSASVFIRKGRFPKLLLWRDTHLIFMNVSVPEGLVQVFWLPQKELECLCVVLFATDIIWSSFKRHKSLPFSYYLFGITFSMYTVKKINTTTANLLLKPNCLEIIYKSFHVVWLKNDFAPLTGRTCYSVTSADLVILHCHILLLLLLSCAAQLNLHFSPLLPSFSTITLSDLSPLPLSLSRSAWEGEQLRTNKELRFICWNTCAVSARAL